MKRVIWVSILLGIAGILLPAFFGGRGVDASPFESQPPEEVSPSPSPSYVQMKAKISDKDTVVSVMSGEDIKDIAMAEHLPLVLAAEMPASFEKEALRAQAVAARTYILYCTKHENPKHADADVCCDSSCCLACLEENELRASWGAAYEENMEAIRSAVKDTDGQVLYYEDEPILASFHSSSAGMTEAGSELWGDVPYLVCVSSPETEKDVPDFVTTVEVSAENMKETILLIKPEAAFSGSGETWIGERVLDESGRVKTISVGGQTLTGSEMRKLFSLRSTAFTLEYTKGIFVFTVTGYGHGLGLSQYGANVMAKNGFDYLEILAHYYPNTIIE